jgi:DNA-binding transcriptional ArsR family regulator
MRMAMSRAGKNGGRSGHPTLQPQQLQAVAELFATLSEPSRLHILQVLQNGPASVSEVVAATCFKQANVSKQLGILQSAGVIARRQAGNHAIYSIEMPLVFDLCELVCKRLAERATAYAEKLTQ